MKKKSSAVSPKTLTDQIYSYLKDVIIRNRLKPNTRIYEKEIASVFNTSKTPVREAILKLSAEGFIEISPNRYAIVKEVSYEKFQEIVEIMILLDSYACRRAITELDDESLKKMKELTEEMEKYCNENTIEKYLDLNDKIHALIWESLKNQFSRSFIMQFYDYFNHIHHQILYSQWASQKSYLRKSLKRHKKLLEVMMTKNTSALSKAIKDHWRSL